MLSKKQRTMNLIKGALKSPKVGDAAKKGLRKRLRIMQGSGSTTRKKSNSNKSKVKRPMAKKRYYTKVKKVARSQGLKAKSVFNELKWSLLYSMVGQPVLAGLTARAGIGEVGAAGRAVVSYLVASNTSGAIRQMAKAGVITEANQAAMPYVAGIMDKVTGAIGGTQSANNTISAAGQRVI